MWKSTKAAPCKESCPARNRARNRNTDHPKIAVIINAKLVIKDLSEGSVLRQGDVGTDSSPHEHGSCRGPGSLQPKKPNPQPYLVLKPVLSAAPVAQPESSLPALSLLLLQSLFLFLF